MNNQEKLCKKCKLVKSIRFFRESKKEKDGYQRYCESCQLKYKKSYYIKNKSCIKHKQLARKTRPVLCDAEKEVLNRLIKESTKSNKILKIKKYINDNKDKISNRQKSWREKNKETINHKARVRYGKNGRIYTDEQKNKRKVYNKKYLIENKQKLSQKRKESSKKYYQKNIVMLSIKAKKYKMLNKDIIKIKNRKYIKRKLKNDIGFKLKARLRNRFYKALNKGYKRGSAVKDLGCNVEQLKIYIASYFKNGMTWENYGRYGWHLDHRIPLCKFNLEDREEFLKACNYTNIRPMWAKDNLMKHDSILPEDIEYARSLGVSV